MSIALFSVGIRIEHDTVSVRQRSRQISRLLGFDAQDQTRISTAVSEIARNAFNYATGGKVEFLIEGRVSPQLFIIKVSDKGPGIRGLDEILEGRYRSETGMGLGIMGARRLMDQFDISTTPGGGTTVLLKKLFPRHSRAITEPDAARIAQELASERPQNAVQELQHQNGELLQALEEIRSRQAELTRVNRELEDTNRGVVALYSELDEKADYLRRADELKSKFLSNMSHEFRSPLNSILALTSLLINRSDGDLTKEQDQQVGYIRRAAQDLLELVNDLLDLAKVEAGKLDVKPLDFEPANLFAALRGMLRPLLANNQSVDLIFEDVGSIPVLYSDEGKISQILRNFISNALKFTERGEVRVSAKLLNEQEICFWVSDTGIGIAPADLQLIFQDFAQLDNPIQRRVKGTGLGLPLSKKLAGILGGRVEVTSKPGEGSTFSLIVPRECARPEEIDDGSEAQQIDSSGKTVLFVEDSAEMKMLYRSYLQNSGYTFLGAATTREAEDLLSHAEPSVIVLDIVLRSEDTWSLMARLKQEAGTKGIPIIVVSTTDDKAKAFHLGADAYLLKPVKREKLLRQLRMLTQDAKMRRVLLIDDNELDRYLIRQHLKQLPVMVVEETSGGAGMARAREILPDMIFLDLTMPDKTGYEVLEALKADPATREIEVVILTSRSLTKTEKDKLMVDAVAVLSKGTLRFEDVAEILGLKPLTAAVDAGGSR